MGLAPWNKLYSIMLTIYSYTRQAEARAYHHRLNGIASGLVQNLMLAATVLSCVFGPCIGYFDKYYDSPTHGQVTKMFVIGEVAYILLIIGVVNSNRDKFPNDGASIDTLVTCRLITIAIGVIQALTTGVVNTWCEWAAFYMAFYIHYQLSTFMRYKMVVVADK